ncbi:hypothetical protein [Amycolatopsis sp. NPDC051061]|uniref:hypothetical protein n=1 Tax=Amycolatopsis sp. NPDC051061 TaxID=3155042 RepID=UPI00342F861E
MSERIEPVLEVGGPFGVHDVEAHGDAARHVRPKHPRGFGSGGELRALQLALGQAQRCDLGIIEDTAVEQDC